MDRLVPSSLKRIAHHEVSLLYDIRLSFGFGLPHICLGAFDLSLYAQGFLRLVIEKKIILHPIYRECILSVGHY